MQRLLAEDGCPWDRSQTLETLRPYVIEEAHEVVDAIDRNDPTLLREELGDLLLQVVFQSALCDAAGDFGLDDVIAGICAKLIRRHPHVFGEKKAGDGSANAAYQSWEAIKRVEKAGRGALDGVPVSLPALLRAMRVGEKAGAAGLDFNGPTGPRNKIDEELAEVDQAAETGHKERLASEIGDLLFSVVNFCRHHEIDPEAALRGTLDRFTERFQAVERAAKDQGRSLQEMSDDEKDKLFEAAKKQA